MQAQEVQLQVHVLYELHSSGLVTNVKDLVCADCGISTREHTRSLC